jgi:ferredoxin
MIGAILNGRPRDSYDQMTLDLSILKDLSLSRSDQEHLRRVSLVSGLYCQGCEGCVTQCTKQLPIPELMRAYLYTYGYRNLVAAQDLLLSLKLPALPCNDCSVCPIEGIYIWGTMGLDSPALRSAYLKHFEAPPGR